MIAYFVYHLDSYSGAAQQALKLSTQIDEKVLFFNFNYKGYKKKILDDNRIIIDMTANKLINVIIIIYFSLVYKIKIYHLHGFFIYGLLLGKLLKKKIILKTTLLGDDDFESIMKRKFGKLKIRVIQKSVDYNIVLTERTKEKNSKYFPIKKIKKIPNGVDIDLSQKIDKEKYSFCFVGLVCERKNTLESIKYFNKYYSNLNNAKLYIVGPYENVENNREFSEEYVKKCFDYIRANNLEKKVIFTGKLSKDKTYDIYKKSSALLFFSKKEGMPNVLLEAMAHKCIPVVSDMDGVSKEIIGDNGGFVLNQYDINIDIQKIDSLIKKDIAINIIRNSFTIDKIASCYANIYSRLF